MCTRQGFGDGLRLSKRLIGKGRKEGPIPVTIKSFRQASRLKGNRKVKSPLRIGFSKSIREIVQKIRKWMSVNLRVETVGARGREGYGRRYG